MAYDPTAHHIHAGLDLSPLGDLTAEQRSLIAQLMARAAERSYRRGFQQGAHIATDRPEDLPADLHEWRYGTTTDLSPWADDRVAETSLDRLMTENQTLSHHFPSELPGQPSGIRAWHEPE